MKKIKRFILLAVLAAMAAVASAASPKQSIDVAFAQLAQTLRRERDVALALITLLGVVFRLAMTQKIDQH